MKIAKGNYLILLVLVLLFATPGITAYLYYLHPQWLQAQTTNKGQLLTPPVLVKELQGKSNKWHLVLWNPAACEASCINELDKLARIRLALGRHLYQVDQELILAKDHSQLTPSLMQTLKQQDFQVHYLPDYALAGHEAKIFIANPDNYLILAYDLTAQSDDIYHDLKQLLTTTEKNG